MCDISFQVIKSHINNLYAIKRSSIYYPLISEFKYLPWHNSSFCFISNKSVRKLPQVIICTLDIQDCFKIATLLHEFGHFLNHKNSPRLFKAYERLNTFSPLSPSQRSSILKEERTAWNKGFFFLTNEFDLDICPTMKSFKTSCLQSYYRITASLLSNQ